MGRIATGVWAVAAGLAAITTLILLAGQPLVGTESLGPEVLLEALAACVLARFTSLPKALAGGVAIGVIGQVVFYNYPHGGERDLVIFAVILGALLFQSRGGARVEEGSSWLLAGVIRPVPRALARRRWYRALGPALAVVALAGAALASLAATNARTLTFITIAAYAILALSTTLIVGVAGQVSLGQVGFFGVGAAVCYQLSVSVGIWFWLAFLAAGVAGALASVLVGLPALRVRGLLFAVTSLGFALVAQTWLLAKPWLLGAGVDAPRPILGPDRLRRPARLFRAGPGDSGRGHVAHPQPAAQRCRAGGSWRSATTRARPPPSRSDWPGPSCWRSPRPVSWPASPGPCTATGCRTSA